MNNPLEAPLCACIQPIEDKYIGIRNAAMEADGADNPGKGSFGFEYIKANAAIGLHAGAYFLELISAPHKDDCPTYRRILGCVEGSRQMCLIKKQGPKVAFERHLSECTAKRLKSIADNEKYLKEHTGALSTIGRTWAYWAHLNSIEHLRMYETIAQGEDAGQGPEPKEEENVFCKSMPIDAAREHFRKLVNNHSMNGEPFLTDTALENFIKRAFLGNTEIPKQVINLNRAKEAGVIRNVFHQFYDMASNEWEPTTQCLRKYVSLLTDNFQNWNFATTQNNFTKKPKRAI